MTVRDVGNNNDPPAIVAPTELEFQRKDTKLYVPVVTLSKRNDFEVTGNSDVTDNNNASSFKDKSSIFDDTETNGTKNGMKMAVPLKYLSNFWRSLEMPLINCKIELSLKWIENCVLTTSAVANKATFKITDAKLYVPVVTLSIKDYAKGTKQLREGFKRSVHWSIKQLAIKK